MEIERNINLIKELFETQKELDQEIFDKYNMTRVSLDSVQLALIDEIGELNHELKASWCWWKSTQAPVNKEKVLEELVDCLHFCLIYDYTIMNDTKNYYRSTAIEIQNKETKEGTAKKFRNLINTSFKLHSFVQLMKELDFTFEEVVEAYFKKNQVNHQRVREGY